jgi:hypothetical protein
LDNLAIWRIYIAVRIRRLLQPRPHCPAGAMVDDRRVQPASILQRPHGLNQTCLRRTSTSKFRVERCLAILVKSFRRARGGAFLRRHYYHFACSPHALDDCSTIESLWYARQSHFGNRMDPKKAGYRRSIGNGMLRVKCGLWYNQCMARDNRSYKYDV